ncbi:MAG: prolyl oligopeptidase family serine peptidase [Myxococcales bacterium]|nr:prolyl oligopeptidase family serine peptidase [Myxococcales bacterium]
MHCLFAHGFEGVPNGHKTRYLREALGFEVTAPLMNRTGWSFEDQVGVVLEAVDADPQIGLLVGSSLGAFAVAVAAARRRSRALKLVLMAPAIGIHACWVEQLGEDGMKLWAEMGALQYQHQGVGEQVELPYRLWTQCRDEAGVIATHPTVVVHGLRDDVIPMQHALAFALRSPGVKRLIGVDDGHRLLDDLSIIGEAVAVLGIGKR